jgi:prepilin-type N-terminal cleavage/methylation domain-containing protein
VAHVAKAERGVTLIEMMVALAIFSVGALGLVRLLYASFEGNASAKHFTQATALAQSKLDALMMQRYDAAALTAGTHNEATSIGPLGTPYNATGGAAGSFTANDGTFARSWTVTESDVNTQNPGNDLKTITVQVRWYDPALRSSRRGLVVGGKSFQ